jgi:hypothetical protein
MRKYTNFNIQNENLLIDFDKLEIIFPKEAAKIGDLIKTTCEKLEKDSFHFLFILYSGRKIINNISGKEAAKIINGKRIKTYWIIKNKEKIKHKFFWVKFKRFSKDETDAIEANWNDNYIFTQQAKEIIVKSGGVVFFNHFLKSEKI